MNSVSRTAVILQPTYLPWLGYFDLIDQSDVCVLLDNAEFSRKSWHQRNRIRTSKGLEWLTVPVRKKGRLHQLLCDVQIRADSGFPRDHLRGIQLSYARARRFGAIFPALAEILGADQLSLSVLNIRLIRWIAMELGIETEFVTSSSLPASGTRSKLMVEICRVVGADTYLAPAGSTYLMGECDPAEMTGIDVLFHHYEHPAYRQVFDPFFPQASVIDLLFNEGAESLRIIRSGRRASARLDCIGALRQALFLQHDHSSE